MQFTRSLTLQRRRPASRTSQAASPARDRNKRANVCQDAALYTCECGFVFKAEVTTSVGCPHCGSAQAW